MKSLDPRFASYTGSERKRTDIAPHYLSSPASNLSLSLSLSLSLIKAILLLLPSDFNLLSSRSFTLTSWFTSEGDMSEVFEGYERQYCELSANLSRKCNSAAVILDREQKNKQITELQAGLEDAEVVIRKMDLEARSLQPSLKAMLLAKLREYKSDLNKLKREVKKLTSAKSDQAAHEELLESGMAESHAASADQRERLAMSTERLNQSSDRIRESRRTVLETEDLGVSILQDLHQQRETLLHAHTKLHGVDDAIDKSKKILSSMSKRMSRNKWIIAAVIAALVLAIISILYFKLSN